MDNFLASNLRFLYYSKQVLDVVVQEKTGISPAALNRARSGRVLKPRSRALAALSEFFGVSEQDLLNTDLSSHENHPAVVKLREENKALHAALLAISEKYKNL